MKVNQNSGRTKATGIISSRSIRKKRGLERKNIMTHGRAKRTDFNLRQKHIDILNFKKAIDLERKDGLRHHLPFIARSMFTVSVLWCYSSLYINLFCSIMKHCNLHRTRYATTCNFLVNED